MLSLLVASSLAGVWDTPPPPVVPIAPPAPTPAPAPAPAPEASTAPAAPSFDLSASARESLLVEAVLVEAPKHYYAVGLSTFIGFGSGHYYAGDIERAKCFLAWQAIGAAVAITGAALQDNSDGEWGGGLVALGGLTFVTGRAWDVMLAADTAQTRSAAMMREAAR